MAQMLPRRGAHLRFETRGEQRLYDRLSEKLEDDYLVWYNVAVGRQRVHPDFIVLHPDRGLLVLEVKDWPLDSIRDISPDSFDVLTQAGLKRFSNPLLQARAHVLEIVRMLQQDPMLQQPVGSPHAGKLAFPWAYGVVFTNITRDEFEQADIERVIPGHLVICKDEMVPSVGEEDFQQCLWTMFERSFPCRLTLPQIDQIRGHVFPDLRISGQAGQFGLFSGETAIPDLMKVMDLQQEQLARSLGSGHRIIHGVAGSGKTMILGYRCLQLAQALNKPVLVLCYNRTLSARLGSMLAERDLSARVHVRTFHSWCREMLKTYHLPIASGGSDMYEKWVESVIEGVEKGHVPRGQYGALMIDEGHDFQPDWYRLVVQMVDPDSNSLLVLYDDAQNIYGGGASRRKFSWKSVGIDAVGHTTILRLNYRNTLEVLSVARVFADEMLTERSSDDEGVPVIQPESAGRRGDVPVLLAARSKHDELAMLVESLRNAHGDGHVWSDMAVLCSTRWQVDEVARMLSSRDIPFRSAVDAAGKDELFDGRDAVRVMTMHSSKGLEFPVVAIPGLGRMGASEHPDDVESEVKLLYVAMTRATHRLVMLHHGDSLISRRVSEAIENVRHQLAA